MVQKEIQQDASYQMKFTVEENGELAGWAFLVVIKNDRHEEPYALLENVYVEQQFRGKGYGKELVETALAEAKAVGCYKIIAQSRYGKEKVHQLYEKFGFRDHGKNFRMDLMESKTLQAD